MSQTAGWSRCAARGIWDGFAHAHKCYVAPLFQEKCALIFEVAHLSDPPNTGTRMSMASHPPKREHHVSLGSDGVHNLDNRSRRYHHHVRSLVSGTIWTQLSALPAKMIYACHSLRLLAAIQRSTPTDKFPHGRRHRDSTTSHMETGICCKSSELAPTLGTT